jgi:hypothetical protein
MWILLIVVAKVLKASALMGGPLESDGWEGGGGAKEIPRQGKRKKILAKRKVKRKILQSFSKISSTSRRPEKIRTSWKSPHTFIIYLFLVNKYRISGRVVLVLVLHMPATCMYNIACVSPAWELKVYVNQLDFLSNIHKLLDPRSWFPSCFRRELYKAGERGGGRGGKIPGARSAQRGPEIVVIDHKTY